MKTTIKILSCLVVMSTIGAKVQAQVGIGIANPHPNAILDMTNNNDWRVVMPRSSVTPATSTLDTVGMLIYYNDGLYLRDSAAFNHINPWKYKYNGSISQSVTFSPKSLVGVGIGVKTPNVLGYLHVTDSVKEVNKTGNSAAIFIGTTTSFTHMIMDADEIMVKSGPATGGVLKLQEGAGSLHIGGNIANNTDSLYSYLHTKIGDTLQRRSLTVFGNTNTIGKVQERGNDLIPPGSIMIWYGDTTDVPAGWGICNGLTHNRADGSGTITSPNLRGRSVLGQGTNGTNNYTVTGAGGSDNKTLATANLPYHAHTGTTNSDGAHSHMGNHNFEADNDDWDHNHAAIGDNVPGYDGHGTANIRSAGSNHSHYISTTGCTGCTATAVDVRSAYYVLVYIIKL